MPIISDVGRRHWRVRLLVWSIYAILGVGAVTMVYPFLLMISLGITGSTDFADYRVVPAYLHDDEALCTRYMADQYLERIAHFNNIYGTRYFTFKELEVGELERASRGYGQALADWMEFLPEVDVRDWIVGNSARTLRQYRRFSGDRFGGDVPAMNLAYHEMYDSFDEVDLLSEAPLNSAWIPAGGAQGGDWSEFKKTVALADRIYPSGDQTYRDFLAKRYGSDVGRLSEAWGREVPSFATIRLTAERPAGDTAEPRDWDIFVSGRWPLRMLERRESERLVWSIENRFRRRLESKYGSIEALRRAWKLSAHERFVDVPMTRSAFQPPAAREDREQFLGQMLERKDGQRRYRAYLQNRYRAIRRLNRSYRTSYLSFEDIYMPVLLPALEETRRDWFGFQDAFVEELGLQAYFGEYLREKYGAVSTMNRTYGLDFGSFDEVNPPYFAKDVADFLAVRDGLRRDYLTRNYRTVIDYIAVRGKALWNTLILVAAMLATTLTVNPLCAYALSRFNLSFAPKVLIFLLATMAFPAEVRMIPSFLLLKEVGFLNTYWALVLPGVASGFSIFLLKGFFDTLPDEIFEAATIDGASALRQFWQIAIPLVKPILAYIALGAFTAAYGGFMWAFVVCQDPDKWTLMVWLFQMQQTQPQHVAMAALTLASLPTLIVFIFAQRVIMRGIILPTYH